MEAGASDRRLAFDRSGTGRDGFVEGGAVFGFLPGVVNAVADCGVGPDGKNNESDGQGVRQPVQKTANNQQAETFGALPKADAAAIDERFGAGLRIADHHGTSHDKAGEESVEEAVDGRVVDEKAHEDGQVGVAVKNRLQECAEKVAARLKTGERASEKVAGRGGNQDHAGGEEASGPKEDAGDDAKAKTGEGKEAGGNVKAGKDGDRTLEDPAKGPSENFDANLHKQR